MNQRASDAEAEIAALVLHVPEAVDDLALEPAEFSDPRLGAIFGTVRSLRAVAEPVTMATVHRSLTGTVGATFISETFDRFVSAGNTAWYVRVIREEARIRRLGIAAREILVRLAERPEVPPPGAIEGLVAKCEETFAAALSDHVVTGGLVKLADELPAIFAEIERRYVSKTPGGLLSGFRDLDAMLGGFRAGESIVVAGRPGEGKTTLGLGFALSVAEQSDTPVAVFSLEMSRIALGERYLASASSVSHQAIRTGFLSQHDFPKLATGSARLSRAPIWIDDRAASSVPEIASECRRQKRKHGLGFVVVDYIGLVRSEGDTREQEVAAVSRDLKALAKNLAVPVVSLSQLNRESSKRSDPTPRLSDLRDSGSIEQDADVVILLHRPEHYDASRRPGEADAIVAKNRNGPEGKIVLAFNGDYCRFTDLEQYVPEPPPTWQDRTDR